VSVANVNYDAGAAEIRITTGDGAVAPYASVIDNKTNDAIFIPSVFPPSTPFSATAGSTFRTLVQQRIKNLY